MRAGREAGAPANFRASRRDAEQLVQLGARRRVLQRLRALRVDELADRERGKRRFVEAADDELLLARVGVDVAAADDDALGGMLVQGRGVLEELRAAEGIEAVDLEPARQERADAAGDNDGLGDEVRAGRGGDVEAAVVAARDRAHLLVEMEAGA